MRVTGSQCLIRFLVLGIAGWIWSGCKSSIFSGATERLPDNLKSDSSKSESLNAPQTKQERPTEESPRLPGYSLACYIDRYPSQESSLSVLACGVKENVSQSKADLASVISNETWTLTTSPGLNVSQQSLENDAEWHVLFSIDGTAIQLDDLLISTISISGDDVNDGRRVGLQNTVAETLGELPPETFRNYSELLTRVRSQALTGDPINGEEQFACLSNYQVDGGRHLGRFTASINGCYFTYGFESILITDGVMFITTDPSYSWQTVTGQQRQSDF